MRSSTRRKCFDMLREMGARSIDVLAEGSSSMTFEAGPFSLSLEPRGVVRGFGQVIEAGAPFLARLWDDMQYHDDGQLVVAHCVAWIQLVCVMFMPSNYLVTIWS